MKKRILVFAFTAVSMSALGQTLEECWQAAEQNYPLIRQYGLIEKTTELTVAIIQKGWLPRCGPSGAGSPRHRPVHGHLGRSELQEEQLTTDLYFALTIS